MKYLIIALLFLLLPQGVSAETITGPNLLPVRIEHKEDKQYLCAANGMRLSEKAYDSIDPLIQGIGIVSAEGRFGLIGENGREILPCEYDSILRRDDCFVVSRDYKYGLVDRSGEVLIPPIYSAMYYENGTAAVTIIGPSGGSGVVDRQGNILIPLKYEVATPFQNQWAMIIRQDTLKANLMNRQGECMLKEDADGFREYVDYVIAVYGTDTYIISLDQALHRKIEGEYGFYTEIPGLFLITKDQHAFLYDAFQDTYTDLGQWNVDMVGFKDGMIAVQDAAGKWGYMNKDFQLIIPCIYDQAHAFREGRAWVESGQEYILLDQNGTEYYRGHFERVASFSEGLCGVKTEEGWGFLDPWGNVLLAPSLQSEEMYLSYENGYCDLMWTDPFAAIYIDKNFEVFNQYDVWDKIICLDAWDI